MRLVTNLANEFEELCEAYRLTPQGKDIVTLTIMFGQENDHLHDEEEPDFAGAWAKFLEEHKHQMTVSPMVGLLLYLLITYWDLGTQLALKLPTLERMLVRDTVQEISDEIHRKANGNAVLVEPEQRHSDGM